MYLSQDARDGLQPNHYHCVEIHWSGTQFGYIIHEIGNRVRGCRWTWTPLSGTQQPDLSGLMLWITSFNCCRTSLLLLLLNVFLKIRAVYLKADSTISGAFQCSACSAGAPSTCTSSTINFLGVEGPFSDEVGPSRAVWRNCRLVGCVGAFSQLLKCFSKLLARLMVSPQWVHFSFWWEVHSGVAWGQFRWRIIWYTSCICVWFFQSNIPLVARSVASPHQSP